jgi:hypothetical protein
MPRQEYGKSGRKRNYHSPAAEAINNRLRSGLSNVKDYDQIEADNRYTRHAYEARKANAAREIETTNWRKQQEADRIAKEAAYNSSIRGRALGGLSSAYGTGKKVAGVVGDVGRGAWELAKKFGRGALAFGRGLYKTGHALKKGAELGYEGAKIAHNSIPDVKNLARTSADLLTGKMKREDFDRQAHDSLHNLGKTWKKPVNYIDSKLDNFADKYIEGSRLQDYAGRAATGLGKVMSLPEQALGGLASWWKGGKK